MRSQLNNASRQETVTTFLNWLHDYNVVLQSFAEMVRIFADKAEMVCAAAEHAGSSLRASLRKQNIVRLLAATGASQIEFLNALVSQSQIDWARVELFHLDEYVGIGLDHPASFARYINDRIVNRTGIKVCHRLDGNDDPQNVAVKMSREISSAPVDLAFTGIGENGHLAFNDPPADFDTDAGYLVVNLDEDCRRQQVGEGWFASIEDVPKQAITISIPQLLKTREILCIVPTAARPPPSKPVSTAPSRRTPQLPSCDCIPTPLSF